VYLKKSELSVPGMKEYTCVHSKPAGKGWGKKKTKTLVLTLGSPLEKGEKKKNPSINPGQPVEKGQEKKNPNINERQLLRGNGRER
jgi:hypothetical protein